MNGRNPWIGLEKSRKKKRKLTHRVPLYVDTLKVDLIKRTFGIKNWKQWSDLGDHYVERNARCRCLALKNGIFFTYILKFAYISACKFTLSFLRDLSICLRYFVSVTILDRVVYVCNYFRQSCGWVLNLFYILVTYLNNICNSSSNFVFHYWDISPLHHHSLTRS